MSTKRKRRYQRQRLPWPVLVLGGALLLVAAILFANRSGAEGAGTASISVDQQKIDYGDVHFGDTKSFAIRVTNTGDGTLRFKEQPYIEILEGC